MFTLCTRSMPFILCYPCPYPPPLLRCENAPRTLANGIILDLLFTLRTWHALAKLCLHTSSTLQIFKSTTKLLGQKLRQWVKKIAPLFIHENFQKRQVLDIGARLQLQLRRERVRRFQYEEKEVEVKAEGKEKVGCQDSQHERRQPSKPSQWMCVTVKFARFSTCVRIRFMLLAIILRPLPVLEQLIAILHKW